MMTHLNDISYMPGEVGAIFWKERPQACTVYQNTREVQDWVI